MQISRRSQRHFTNHLSRNLTRHQQPIIRECVGGITSACVNETTNSRLCVYICQLIKRQSVPARRFTVSQHSQLSSFY
ncbi:hypothetical protein NPIL_171801 [Nephila pilipes]|uniref:Uncharacterized protein n=1 Tax=Nephila pilipes TaxID=299642 RepID=A0A8X6MZK4_NEPPI|nr:hypothetical protein NPIL_171801 [Nephila pilipes]